MIEIFPAIDLHNGQAVRLKQGDYNQVEVFLKTLLKFWTFLIKIIQKIFILWIWMEQKMGIQKIMRL